MALCPMFKVQTKPCATCIYSKRWHGTPIAELEAQIRDKHIGFSGHRVCHHSKDVCCRGFWSRHKDEFAMGQIAQRFSLVEFVRIDTEPHMTSAALKVRPIKRGA